MSFYDRSDYFGASQQSTFSRSALSSSNVLQNMNEPTFLIPRVPDVIKVPEPLPPRKPPQPGFDMKTLRKQIEFLYSEVQDRTENYNLIVQQNQQLWNYITELLEANKGNALKMREYVKNLTDELRTVYRERMEYAEKLELAKNSQEMLLSLNRELEQSSLTKEELNKRRQEAQNELIRAKKEREELQQILQEKLNQVENYEEQLQEMRYAKYEQDTIDKADDFYYSNKIVLKSAYHRFRQGVKQRLKLMKIHEILQNKLYYYYLKVKTFQQWHHYRLIQRKMKKSQINRRKEALLLFFTKWKVFRALETLFQRSARRRLLTSCFINWKDYLKSCYDDKADERKLIAFKLHLIKKKFFHSWKRSVLFLSWYSPHTLALEQKAIEYFRFKIFRCWQRLYYQEKAAKQDRLYYINLIRLKSHWKAWHLLAHRQWKMRGRLLRRFFFSLRQRLGNHSHFHQLHRQARHYSLHKEKKKFLQRWRQWFLSTRKRRQTSRPRAEQLSHSRMRRRLKGAFLHLQYTVAMDRRQRLSLTYAVRYWRVERLSLALGKLKGRGVSKFIARRHFLSKNFNLFIRKSRLDRQRHEYAIHRRNQSVFFEKKLKKFRLMISLQKWLSTIRQKKSNLLLHLLVHQKTVKSQLHQHWRVWKALFFKRIYWKHREQMVENSRLTSLVTLYERQSSDIIEEYQKTVTEKDQLEETILQLQELIANKSNQLEKQLTVIEQQKVEKSKTQELIDQLHLQIEQLEIQEKQWKLLELSYREEKEKEMKEREKKKKETLHYLTNLQQQSINLHQQFLQNNLNTSEGDREGTDMDYHAVLQDLSDVLSEREQEKSQSLLSLQESASELKLLESDEESLTIEIDKVQRKMKEITHESDVLLKDNQKLLRERVSEVRVLREDASLAQARVTSLLEIANEYKQENVGGRMTLTEINEEQRGRRVDTNEEEEVAMMHALKKKHEDEFATLLAGASVQTPATATTHAVTSLAVSPIGRRERVSSMESKDSPSDASSSSLSLGSEDVRFQDARNTIRMLSQKLSTPTASHLTAASLDSRRVSSIPAGSVGGVRRSASGDIDHAIKN